METVTQNPSKSRSAAPGEINRGRSAPARILRSKGLGVIAIICLRIVLGGIFLYAGVLKATDAMGFLGDLRGFHLLPERALPMAAAFVPYLEILVGIALIFGIFYSGALLLSGGLLVAFIGFIASAIWRGLDIHCGCFGHRNAGHSLYMGLVRDAGILSVWLALVWFYIRSRGRHVPLSPSRPQEVIEV